MKKAHNDPDSCIACTSCVAYCPVSAVTRKYAGPKMMGPALERFRNVDVNTEFSLEYCSNCKNCDISCPSGVPISTLNMLAKSKMYKTKRHSLLEWILAHSDILSKLASPIAALANFGMANPLTKWILKMVGVTDTMSLPSYAGKTFTRQFREFRQQSFSDKVVFFPGCYINYYEPGIGMDFVAVMQENRFEVVLPEGLDCCGSPLVVQGYLDEAVNKGRTNIAALKPWFDQGVPVITCCTSCGLMLKMEYQELMELDHMDKLAEHTYDSSEFLLELNDQGRLNLKLAPLPGKYMYHTPCHLRAQGIGRPSLEVLRLIPELRIEDADAGCCGQSGTYGFQVDRHEIAMAIGEPVFQRIKEYRPDAIVSDCSGCRMQLSQATGFPAVHPMTLLRRSYQAAKA
jgi:glycerol-3-phosphate dehydrogenase subunit C